jgi:cytochrome P450
MCSKKVSFMLNFFIAVADFTPALRLYPSVPINLRAAVRTTILPTGGGPDGKSPILIPKNTGVAFCLYAMHRRPDFYGLDAELFRPERWDEDLPLFSDPVKAKWGYLPFNGGPRICLGSKFFLSDSMWNMWWKTNTL